MIRKKSRTFSLFAERIGIKILFEIGLLLIIVCGTLSIISYPKSSNALQTSIQTSLEYRAKDTASIFEKELINIMKNEVLNDYKKFSEVPFNFIIFCSKSVSFK